MNRSITTVMIRVVRLCGLVALGTGVLSWFAFNSPMLVHIIFGSLLASALCIITFQSRSLAGSLVVLGAGVAVLVPLLGLLELRPVLGEFQWTLQWLHPAIGIGSIGMAEVLAKRIRLAGEADS